MIKTIIIEDEVVFSDILVKMIADYCGEEVKVLAICKNAEDGYLAIQKFQPDLLFLDVEMSGMNGVDLLNQFAKLEFQVVFTTSHDRYALLAIKYEATDYLLKPYSKIDFIKAIEKVKKNLTKQNYVLRQTSNKVIITGAEGVQFVEVKKIIRCESDSNYTTYFILGAKPIIVSKTLKEVEETFKDYSFCRVHRTHLVNLEHVVKYQKGDGGCLVMVDGSNVAVSRSHKEELMNRLSIS